MIFVFLFVGFVVKIFVIPRNSRNENTNLTKKKLHTRTSGKCSFFGKPANFHFGPFGDLVKMLFQCRVDAAKARDD